MTETPIIAASSTDWVLPQTMEPYAIADIDIESLFSVARLPYPPLPTK